MLLIYMVIILNIFFLIIISKYKLYINGVMKKKIYNNYNKFNINIF